MKGAWVLHTLRTTIDNDTMFFDILKSYATRYRAKTVTTKDFITVVNEKTGKDYSWFFYQYLSLRDVPELDVAEEHDKATGEYLLYFKWSKTRSDFHLPVKITVRYKDGEQNYTTGLTPDVDWKYIVIDKANAPKDIIYHTWNAYYRIKKSKHSK